MLPDSEMRNANERPIMQLRLLESSDVSWAARVILERWGGPFVVSKGRMHDTRKLPGLVASIEGRPVGLLTFCKRYSQIEIVTLDALEEGKGIGRALVKAVCAHAAKIGVRRIWLITSNDNVGAVAFYTRRGFRLVHVWLDAITEARKLKPQIPEKDDRGVPIRDELEFEMRTQK